MPTIAENLRSIQERISRAAERVGRTPGEITLIAVSKTRSVEEISDAIQAGVTVIGENRVQETEAKWRQVNLPVRWHLVGHLQRNKVKKALRIFEMIHSLDSLRLANEIDRRAWELSKAADVLVQVNTSAEESKFGIEPDQTLDFVGSLSGMEGLQIRGLMTIGPFLPDVEKVRPCFIKLRGLKEKIEEADIPNVRMDFLSMGMTNDFEVAIEEGANMVRVGTGIFGERR